MNTYVLSVVQQKSRARLLLPSWGRVTERTIKHVYCPFRNFYYIIYQMSTESHLSEHLLRAVNSVYPFRWNRQIVVKTIGSGSVNGTASTSRSSPRSIAFSTLVIAMISDHSLSRRGSSGIAIALLRSSVWH